MVFHVQAPDYEFPSTKMYWDVAPAASDAVDGGLVEVQYQALILFMVLIVGIKDCP